MFDHMIAVPAARFGQHMWFLCGPQLDACDDTDQCG